ncbi:MAG: hypothetical protein ACYDCS_07690 [Candidatus Dormibacteria bacterium]
MAKAQPVAPPLAPVVVAIQSFAGYPHFQVSKGQRFRVDSEVVKRWPQFFIADGSTDQEIADALNRVAPPPEPTQHEQLATTPKPLQDEDAVICVRNLHSAADGDTHLGKPLALATGTRLRHDHPLVKANRDCFVEVVPAGRTRENSVRAKTDWAEYARHEDGSYVEETDFNLRMRFGEFKRVIQFYRGQYIDRDHPIVKQRPTDFEPIEASPS